jgi:hypothetical protein
VFLVRRRWPGVPEGSPEGAPKSRPTRRLPQKTPHQKAPHQKAPQKSRSGRCPPKGAPRSRPQKSRSGRWPKVAVRPLPPKRRPKRRGQVAAPAGGVRREQKTAPPPPPGQVQPWGGPRHHLARHGGAPGGSLPDSRVGTPDGDLNPPRHATIFLVNSIFWSTQPFFW